MFFLFFSRGLKYFILYHDNQNKMVTAAPLYSEQLLFQTVGAQISRVITKRSEQIWGQSKICWKEHELSFSDCI